MLGAWKVMIAALFTIGGCYAAGAVAVRWSRASLDRMERAALSFLTGAALIHFLMFAVMTARVAHAPVFAVMLAAPILWELVARRSERGRSEYDPKRPRAGWGMRILFFPIFAAYSAVYLANAWLPDTSADGAGYHLAIIAQYLRAHGFIRMPTDMYADLSQGIEMVYAPAFAFAKHSGPPLVHFAFLVALGLAIYAYGRRIGRPWVGAAAAALVYVSPVLGRDATTSYIDVATAAAVFAAFYWLQIWDEHRHPRLLILAGVMAGYAFAAKYTMFVMVPYALIFVAWRERRIRPVLIAATAAGVMIGPWLIKNWILVDDPVAPFATRIFPSPYFHTLTIDEWSAYLRRYDIENLWTLPLEDTVRGARTQGLIGPVFLLAPIAIFALRDRIGRRLVLLGAILLATYFANVGTRFLIPCLPFFALAMMIPLDAWRVELVALVLIQAVASWFTMIPVYASKYAWRLTDFPYKAALRITPEQDYLKKYTRHDLLRMLEEKTAPGDRIFSLTGFEKSYVARDVFETYEGAENSNAFDILNVARIEDFQPTRILVFHFPEQRTDRIRLLETARGQSPQQWNVHELRFYDHGKEVQRSSSWRLRAWPNPWDIQFAFDNSPVTRWRSWRTGEPGMFIDVNFAAMQNIDEIRMWTSSDWPWPMQFQVQTGGEGHWQTIGGTYEETTEPVRRFLGPDSMHELYVRGVRFLLVPDSDRSASDFGDSPEAWRLELVGRANETSLYRLLP